VISGINLIVVSGNAGKDAEVKFLQNGNAVGRFTLAVNNSFSKDKEKPPMWLTVKVFGKQAEYCGENIKKGTGVAVSGRLEFETWNKPDGTQGSAYVVIASEIRRNFENGQAQPTAQPQQAAQPQPRSAAPSAPPSRSNGTPPPPVQTLDDDSVPF
jgi:single-strand DNA-binding protein